MFYGFTDLFTGCSLSYMVYMDLDRRLQENQEWIPILIISSLLNATALNDSTIAVEVWIMT